MNEPIWTGEQLATEMGKLEIKQQSLVKLTGLSATLLSFWMNDIHTPSPERARKVQRVIEGLKILRERGVAENMNVRIGLLRRKLQELDSEPAEIPQVWGRQFAVDWGAKHGFTLEQTLTAAQFHRRVLAAEILSAPAQRWLRAFTASIENVLGGVTFGEYARNFPDTHTALTAVANAAFAALLHEVGKEKILEYLAALVVTGEVHQAPVDADEN